MAEETDDNFTFKKDITTVGDFIVKHRVLDRGYEYQIPGCSYTIFVVKPVYINSVERMIDDLLKGDPENLNQAFQGLLVFYCRGILVSTFGVGTTEIRAFILNAKPFAFKCGRDYFYKNMITINGYLLFLAGGLQGNTYRFPNTNLCLKVSKLDTRDQNKTMAVNMQGFHKEATISLRASNICIGPKFFLGARGIMFMEFIQGLPVVKLGLFKKTVRSIADDQVLTVLDQVLKIMHDNGIEHADLHYKNIMVREIFINNFQNRDYKAEIGDVVVIDFGFAELHPQKFKKEWFTYNEAQNALEMGKKMAMMKLQE